jgi:hypothetical protein
MKTVQPETPRLNFLAAKLSALRDEKRFLEEDIKKVTDEIFEIMGTDNEWLTELFLIKTKHIERQIFDKDAFIRRFGAEIYPQLTKPAFSDVVFLSSQEGV